MISTFKTLNQPCHFRSEDIRYSGDCQYTPPWLTIQQIELDGDGEFKFIMSHVESAEEFYVHPLQQSSTLLGSIERELDTIPGK